MRVITPSLSTPRLTLRPFEESDYEAVYKWCSSLEVTKYLFWYPHKDIEVSKRVLHNWTRKRRNYSWAIVIDKEPIGEVEVIKSLANNGVELGYTLREDMWGKGIMHEALTGIMDYLFMTMKASYIYCETDSRNVNSIRLLSRLGFTKSGEKPYHIAKKNEDIVLSCYQKTKP